MCVVILGNIQRVTSGNVSSNVENKCSYRDITYPNFWTTMADNDSQSQINGGHPGYPELSTFELFEKWVSKDSRFEVVLSESEKLEQVSKEPGSSRYSLWTLSSRTARWSWRLGLTRHNNRIY